MISPDPICVIPKLCPNLPQGWPKLPRELVELNPQSAELARIWAEVAADLFELAVGSRFPVCEGPNELVQRAVVFTEKAPFGASSGDRSEAERNLSRPWVGSVGNRASPCRNVAAQAPHRRGEVYHCARADTSKQRALRHALVWSRTLCRDNWRKRANAHEYTPPCFKNTSRIPRKRCCVGGTVKCGSGLSVDTSEHVHR